MMILNEYTQRLIAIGFVGFLGLVGLVTHCLMDPVDRGEGALGGALQSKYEAGFNRSNPLNTVSVSVMSTFKYAVFGQAKTGAIVGKDGWLFTAEELEVREEFHANMSRAATEIARVQSVMAQKGTVLVPVIVPDKADVFSQMLRQVRPDDVQHRRLHFMSLLADLDVAALDAFGAIKAVQTGFMRDDTHWSPRGSRAVAQQIAAYVELAHLGLAPVAVKTIQGPSTDFDGDLLKFVPTGVFRTVFGPAQNQIETYITTVEASGGLFGDTDVDVALVGTSFSAKPEWNFAGFLQDALGADLLNMSAVGQGPFKPMQAYLASEKFQNSPPKLVVWEIPVRYTSKDMNQ
ncbi:putative alginate O-acetylase AlgJ [Ascidiaceihabitans donghaensis]|uniref:Putative alginate O-acetylase AlgJ n=1 Tax=Ascidiaceihabitans donghaensis TaxID=1510460 RepID=A0A2R8BC47_9RHOB|nr:hypothetical protein [Ascidiaceihabitans donghaensis]SPH20612.1 putative alginate O-acetylase AlgJ [Ascidiaceihabitans donghaensis]